MPYNPFKKDIGEALSREDLQELVDQGVAEGFYVEYKKQFVQSLKIAATLASFANTYGGWYFIGIESEKTENKATTICGIDLNSVNDPIAKLEDAARQNLSHMPLMFPQIVAMENGKAVLAVYIPEADDTPYLTRTGVIYRRAGAASDPVPETSKHLIDQMIDKSRREIERFNEFCVDDRQFAQAETNPWLNIYFRPHPSGIFRNDKFLSLQHLSSLLEKSQSLSNFSLGELQFAGNAPFVSGQFLGDSIVLRINRLEYVGFNGLMLRLYKDGSAKIHIPINVVKSFPINHFSFTNPEVQYYLNTLYQSGFDSDRVLNLANFSEVLMDAIVLTQFYENWLRERGWDHNLWMRTALTSAWRLLPIFESSDWVKFCQTVGAPPIINVDSVVHPRWGDELRFFDSKDSSYSVWIEVMFHVATCVGIAPIEVGGIFAHELIRRHNITNPDKPIK